MTLRKRDFHSPKASYEAFQLLYLLKAVIFLQNICRPQFPPLAQPVAMPTIYHDE